MPDCSLVETGVGGDCDGDGGGWVGGLIGGDGGDSIHHTVDGGGWVWGC